MKTQKGITLIALIITIIVMLILVGVSVSVALNTGLFKTAQGVAKNTQLEADAETKLAEGTINVGGTDISIDEYIDRISSGLPVELKIGDIIEYTPESNYTSDSPYVVSNEETATLKLTGCTGSFYTDMGEDVEWKVIGIEGKTIKIIPNAVSSASLAIGGYGENDENLGANGWNNSIKALNNVCGAIYGNTTNDKYTATAKSLTVEDINEITGYIPTASSESYNASDYAEDGANYFPIEYLKEKGITNPTEKTAGCGYSANSNITIQSTSYSYSKVEDMTTLKTKFKNWVDLDTNYWLASRGVTYDASQEWFEFSIFWFAKVSTGSVNARSIFNSNPAWITDGYGAAVRPVVSLTPAVTPTIAETKDGINYWTFETN